MLNQLLSNVAWGARGNFLSIPTDTPARDERLGWTGDISIFAPTASYLSDTRAFLGKWMTDVRDEQKSNGDIPAVVPSSQGAFNDSGVGWDDAVITVPYALWNAYGDSQVVQDNYETMKKFFAYAKASAGADNLETGRTTFFTGDWLHLDDPSDQGVLGTAIWAQDVRMMAGMAAGIGKDAEAADYTALYKQIKDAFVGAYVASDGTVKGGSQTGYALALGMGLIDDPALQKKVGDKYVAKLAKTDNHLRTGFIGTPWLLPALTNIGRDDIAYDLLKKEDYPSWGYEISKGATTVWERWNSIQPDGSFGPVDMNSFNHYAYGAVADWMHQSIGGIKIGEAGYRTSVIEPRPGGGLTHAEGRISTVYGELSNSWKTTDDGITLDVHVPVNTTSEIRIPSDSQWAVTESGHLLNDVDGVKKVTYDADAKVTVVTVGSGSYEFAASKKLSSTASIVDALDDFKGAVDDASPLGDEPRSHLLDETGKARDSVLSALGSTLTGDDAATSGSLDEALGTIRALKVWVDEAGLDPTVADELGDRLQAIARLLSDRIAAISGITLTLPKLEDPVAPGGTAHGALKIVNSGSEAVTNVSAEISVPGIATKPVTVTVPEIAAGADRELTFDIRVSTSRRDGTYDANALVSLTRAGKEYELEVQSPKWLQVKTPVSIDKLDVAYPQDGQADVKATLTNTGTKTVTGRLRATAPEGWVQATPSGQVTIGAGETVDVTVPVYVLRDADPGSYPIPVTFEDRGASLASATAQVEVAALALPPTGPTTDYVDFGNSSSESAHAVTGSSSSGTSSEAGFTRRYAHNGFPGSWYSAKIAVTPGQPFILRMRETWNSAGTKDYDIYIGDKVVKHVRTSRSADGQGVSSYQVLVNDKDAIQNDGTVTVKFLYPASNAPQQYYDPSIADLWVMSAPDTIAPTVSATANDDAELGENGWYTGPVDVTLAGADDSGAAPKLEYDAGDGWQDYSTPIAIDGDGVHTIASRATDGAGNVSAPQQLQVGIDTAPPTVALDGGPSGDVGYGSVPAAPACVATDATSGIDTCVISGYGTTIGEHTVVAVATDVAGHESTATRTYAVGKGTQVLAMQTPTSASFGDKNVEVSATSSAGLPVSLSATGACELTDSKLSMTGTGDCVLTASQAGNENYLPATEKRTISVGRADQTISFTPPTKKTYGDKPFSVSATSSSGLTVSLAAAGKCKISGGKVTLTGAGTCVLTARQAGNANVNPAGDVVRKITVARASFTRTTVTLTGTSKVGRTLRAHVSFTPSAQRYLYSWYRDGVRIYGAHSRTYVLKKKDGGKKVWVRVTASRDYYNTVVKNSAKRSIKKR